MHNTKWADELNEEIEEKFKHKEAREYFDAQGKLDINEMVWKLAPGHITLDEAEEIAIGIYNMFLEKWDK